MTPQLDQKIVTSLMLMVDHEIQKQGSAFRNVTGQFWHDEDEVQGLYTYTTSYKQLCNDTSISGANVMSGVYVNGVYTPVGFGNLVSINHYDGSVNFSAPVNGRITGSFAVKEFAVYLSDGPDYQLIMDSKFTENPKYASQATGMSVDMKVFPAIILVPKEQEMRPLGFGGIDDNFMRIRAVVVAQNVYQRIGACNILKNLKLRNLPLFNNLPLDYAGNMTGVNYNWNNLTFYPDYAPFIREVKSTLMPNDGTFSDPTKQVALVDFDISAWGGHR